MAEKSGLDGIDAQLLQLIQQDGRRPYAELGAAVGISGPAAHERVKKLEARGVITGYGARVSAEAIGLGVLAFTWVTQAPGDRRDGPDRRLRRRSPRSRSATTSPARRTTS